MSEPDGLLAPAWNRLAGESARAHEAARVYFEMRASRSLAAVARKLDKSVSLLERWSKRWQWVARAAAFDDHLFREEQSLFEKEALARSAKWRRRADEEVDERYNLGQSLKNKAAKMVDFPLASITKEDGKTIIRPNKWSLRDAAALATAGSRLSREAIDQALEAARGVVPEEFITEDYT